MDSHRAEVPEEARLFNRFSRALLLLGFLAGGWFLLHGVSELYRGRASRSWPTVAGRVIHSVVTTREVPSRRQRSIVPYVEYVYRVDGQEHLGTAITVSGGGTGEDYSRARVARYPEGATVRVAYDPSEPQRSCLEPGVDRSSVAGWFAVGFGICLLGPVLGFLQNFRRRPISWLYSEPDPEVITLGLDDHPPRSPSD